MDEKRKGAFPPVGISSLLVIFAVLCLTVFALLSVSTVRADRTLSDNAAAAVEGYYRADYAAEQTLARLRAGERPDGVTEINGIYCYAHPISDTQTLVVEVSVDGTDYDILRWQAVSTARWQAGDQLPIWNGEMKEDSAWQP